MNEKPHVHNVVLRRQHARDYHPVDQGPWVVVYGDTVVYVRFLGRLWNNHEDRAPSDRLVRRAIRRAIRRHDAGSIRAGEHAAQLQRRLEREAARRAELTSSVVADANALLKDHGGWGASIKV